MPFKYKEDKTKYHREYMRQYYKKHPEYRERDSKRVLNYYKQQKNIMLELLLKVKFE